MTSRTTIGVEAQGDDILYHYCSTAAFHSIISGRSIRLSALSLSNDSMEGRVLVDAFTRVAENDGLEREKLEILLKILEMHHEKEEGFGFCLSSRGDLLSQWRGYADDARGVAIGFSKVWLKQWIKKIYGLFPGRLSLKEMMYDKDDHDRKVQPLYESYKREINNGVNLEAKRYLGVSSRTNDPEVQRNESIKADLDLTTGLTTIAFQFIWKSPAFSEEQEWRLLRLVDIKRAESNSGTESTVKYAPKGDHMVAYVEYPLDDIEVDLIGDLNVRDSSMKLKPIEKVILGPKHCTPKYMVDQFLRSHGFIAHVEESAASYR